MGELPEATPSPAPRGEEGGVRSYGFEVQELTPELRARLGLDEGGVAVSGVEPGSLAARAGLQRGDLILEADRRPIADIPDLASVLTRAGDAGTLLLVQRAEETFFVMLESSRG
jgi:S1-C subfamily serine protease